MDHSSFCTRDPFLANSRLKKSLSMSRLGKDFTAWTGSWFSNPVSLSQLLLPLHSSVSAGGAGQIRKMVTDSYSSLFRVKTEQSSVFDHSVLRGRASRAQIQLGSVLQHLGE